MYFEFPDVTVCPDSRRSYLRRKMDDRLLPLWHRGEQLNSSAAFKAMTQFWYKLFKKKAEADVQHMKANDYRPLARRSLLPFLRYSSIRIQPEDRFLNCHFAGGRCTSVLPTAK